MAWLFHTDKVESWAYMDKVFTPEECEKIVRIGLAKDPKESTIIGDNMQGEVDKSIRAVSYTHLTLQTILLV